MKLTPAAASRTSTCPPPGLGSGRSSTRSTSAPPGVVARTARMAPVNAVRAGGAPQPAMIARSRHVAASSRPISAGSRRSWWPSGKSFAEYAINCIVMHVTITVAVSGASGYAGGEVLRLLPATPRSRSAPSPRTRTPASSSVPTSRTCAASPTACWSRPTPAVLAGHDVVVLALPHGASGAVAAELGPDVARAGLRCGPPARRLRRLACVLRHRARRDLALRPARAPARVRRPAARPPAPGARASRSPGATSRP